MNKLEAKQVLDSRVEALRARSYGELLRLMDATETMEIVGPSGSHYQVETEVFWDDKRGGDLRVVVSIDDSGWRAFVPMNYGFVKRPDE